MHQLQQRDWPVTYFTCCHVIRAASKFCYFIAEHVLPHIFEKGLDISFRHAQDCYIKLVS